MFNRLVAACKVDIDDELDPSACVAWIGRNQTGKTARLEAIELALTGKRRAGDVDDLALPPRGGVGHAGVFDQPVMVDLTGEGFAAHYGCAHLLDRANNPHRVDGPDGFVPRPPVVVRPATWLLEYGAAKTREEVFARWGDTSLDVLAPPGSIAQTPHLAAAWQQATEVCYHDLMRGSKGQVTSVSKLDVLAEVPSWCRSAKLRVGKSIKALEGSITARRSALAAAGTGVEQMPVLESQLAEAEAWERTAQARAQLERLAVDAAKYQADADALLALPALEDPMVFEPEIKIKNVHVDTLKMHLATLQSLRAAVPENMLKCECFMCGGTLDTQEATDRLDPAIKETKAVLEGAQRELDEVARARSKLVAEHAARESRRAALEREYARLVSANETLSAALVGAPAAYNGPSSTELRARVAAVRQAAAELAAIEKDVLRLDAEKREQEAIKTVEKAAAIRLSELVAGCADRMIAAVSRFLAADLRLAFESERFVVYGRDGRTHGKYEMSGREFAELTLALALAWAEGSPAVLLLEFERDLAGLDPGHVVECLSMIANAKASGMIAGAYLATSRGDEVPVSWQRTWLADDGTVHRIDAPNSAGEVTTRTEPARDLATYKPDLERDPMLANLGDCQSPAVASWRAEIDEIKREVIAGELAAPRPATRAALDAVSNAASTPKPTGRPRKATSRARR